MQLDFCLTKLHFLTHLAVNAKCCVKSNLICSERDKKNTEILYKIVYSGYIENANNIEGAEYGIF